METIYVIFKCEDIQEINECKNIESKNKDSYMEGLSNVLRNEGHLASLKPLDYYYTEKEALERIKTEIQKNTSDTFSIEKRYIATKDERRKALIP